MPITIMVDLFSCVVTIHRTIYVLFFLNVLKGVTITLMSSLMDSSWGSKVSDEVGVIRCTVDHATIVKPSGFTLLDPLCTQISN